MQRKLKYKLIKDTPTRKAGTVFTLSADNRYINLSDGTNCNEIYSRCEVEDNTEWFEPIFEVGDWISNENGVVLYVDCINFSSIYSCKYRPNYHISANSLIMNYRLATKEEILKVFPFKVGDVVYDEVRKCNIEIINKSNNCYKSYCNASTFNCLDYVIDNYWTRFKRKATFTFLPYKLITGNIVNFNGTSIICDGIEILYDDVLELHKQLNNIYIATSHGVLTLHVRIFELNGISFMYNELCDICRIIKNNTKKSS